MDAVVRDATRLQPAPADGHSGQANAAAHKILPPLKSRPQEDGRRNPQTGSQRNGK